MRPTTAVRVLTLAGAAGIVALTSKLHADLNGYDYTGSPRLAWSLVFVAVIGVVMYGVGLPDLTRTRADVLRAALAVLVLSGLAISSLQLFVGDALLPRFVVGSSLLLLVPWLTFCAFLATRGRTLREARDRVLLVGSTEDAGALAAELARDAEVPATLVRHVDPAALLAERGRPLLDAARDAAATVVVLSRESQGSDDIVHQAGLLHESGIRVRTLSMFYEQWLGKLPVGELERVSLLFDISELHRAVYGRSSRILDVVISALALVPFLVVLPVVVLGNAIANRGPLFYRQRRVGKNGAEFLILKFRTMRAAGQELANEWTTEDDPRITPFGGLLRRTHIDELPQLLNILRGDLSLVGPRPEQPHYVSELTAKLPFYGLRHLVKPGLTGWAQVKFGYAGTETDALEKLQYEFYYLRHQSLALDVKILFRTFRHVLRAGGR